MTIAANIANNRDALAEYGIEVADQEGNLRSTYEVLKDLSEIWGTMTDTERVALGQVLAGKNQFKVLTSVLSNFSHAIAATETAYNSAGSAARENAKYMDSLEAKTTNLQASFQKLANDIISKELVGSILDLTNGLVNLADTGIGSVLTKTALFAGAGFGLSQLNQVTKFLPTIIAQFQNLSGVLSGTMGFASAALPILLAIGAAIFTIAEAIKAVQSYRAEHSLEGITQRFKDASADIQDTSSSLEEAKKKLEELNEVEDVDRGFKWREETEALKETISYYEYLLGLQRTEREEAAQEYREKDKSLGYGANVWAGFGYQEDVGSGNIVDTLTQQQRGALGQTYNTETEAVLTLANAFGLVTDKTASTSEAVADLKQQLAMLDIEVLSLEVSADEYNLQQTELIQNYLEETQGVEELTQAQLDLQQSLLSNNDILYQALLVSDNLTESELGLKTAYEQLAISAGNTDQLVADIANTLGISVVDAVGRLGTSCTIALSHFQQLEDGTWVVVDALENVAGAATDAGNALITGNQAAYDMAMKLLQTGTEADTTSQAFRNLVAQEIIFNQTGIDVSQKIIALQQLAMQAGITASAIASVQHGAVITSAAKQSGYIATVDDEGNTVYTQVAKGTVDTEAALQQYYANLLAAVDPTDNKDTKPPPTTYGGGGSVQKAKDEIEKSAQDTLNNISSATSQTIQDAAKEAQEAAKKTLDKIASAVKEFYDNKINALKEQNEEIDKQVQLEEKLKALEEAKAKQILIYKDGQYQYSQDLGAIAAAQKDYDKFISDMERDAQVKVLEDTRDKILKVLEQIESNLDGYSQQQLEYIANLSTNITSAVGDISNTVNGISATFLSTLQALASGSGGSGGSLDLLSLLGLLGGGSSGSSSGSLVKKANLDMMRNWRQGSLVSMAYLAETGIPLDVQWWMSIFEAEMAEIVRNGGNIGGAFDPRNLDPDSAKHLDIDYWLDQMAKSSDLYESMDYVARAKAVGYVLAEFANGYFESENYKNFDPATIASDIRKGYKNQYIENPDAVLMSRFKQYYSPKQMIESAAQETAYYFNQNEELQNALWAAMTPENVYAAYQHNAPGSRSLGMWRDVVPDIGLYNQQYGRLTDWEKERYQKEADQNRQYAIQLLEAQIAQNSSDWFNATPEEQAALHRANEDYRAQLAQLRSGEATGGYDFGIAETSMGYQNKRDQESWVRDENGDWVLWQPGMSAVRTKWKKNVQTVSEAVDALGLGSDYDSATYVAAQESLLDQLGSNSTTNYNIDIGTINLPDVLDSDGFITGLRNLAYQYSYTRQ